MKRFEGRRRFVVIDPADAMNPQAQNALLKTLEEPPDETTLVLVAASPDALLPTVRSRCQRVAFAPLPASIIEDRLTAAGRSPEEARLATALASGSLGRALALDTAALAERRKAIEDVARLGPDDAREWITFAREYGSGREAAAQTCELILLWLRDVLALVVAPDRAPLALGDLAGVAREAAAKLDAIEVFRRRDRVEQALAALRHNAAAALTLERMLIGWFHG
jgi:DNA polymerase-3 subunit delta'